MLRAVVDVNVLVSAALTPGGSPHRLLERWLEGAFELLVSPRLLAELERVLARPKISDRAHADVLSTLVTGLQEGALMLDDAPIPRRVVERDRDDDYLVALAQGDAHVIVTGDRHLLDLEGIEPPALDPRRFVELLERIG